MDLNYFQETTDRFCIDVDFGEVVLHFGGRFM